MTVDRVNKNDTGRYRPTDTTAATVRSNADKTTIVRKTTPSADSSAFGAINKDRQEIKSRTAKKSGAKNYSNEFNWGNTKGSFRTFGDSDQEFQRKIDNLELAYDEPDRNFHYYAPDKNADESYLAMADAINRQRSLYKLNDYWTQRESWLDNYDTAFEWMQDAQIYYQWAKDNDFVVTGDDGKEHNVADYWKAIYDDANYQVNYGFYITGDPSYRDLDTTLGKLDGAQQMLDAAVTQEDKELWTEVVGALKTLRSQDNRMAKYKLDDLKAANAQQKLQLENTKNAAWAGTERVDINSPEYQTAVQGANRTTADINKQIKAIEKNNEELDRQIKELNDTYVQWSAPQEVLDAIDRLGRKDRNKVYGDLMRQMNANVTDPSQIVSTDMLVERDKELVENFYTGEQLEQEFNNYRDAILAFGESKTRQWAAAGANTLSMIERLAGEYLFPEVEGNLPTTVRNPKLINSLSKKYTEAMRAYRKSGSSKDLRKAESLYAQIEALRKDTVEMDYSRPEIIEKMITNGENINKWALSNYEESQRLMEQVKQGMGKYGKFAVDATSSIADIGLDTVTGLGMWGLAIRAFGTGAMDYQNMDADLLHQALGGALGVAVEALSEKLGGTLGFAYGKGYTDDAIEYIIESLAKDKAGMNALRLLAGAISEGGEEVVSDLFQPLIDWVGDQRHRADWSYKLDAKEILRDFLLGAAAGLFGDAVNVATGDYAAKNAQIEAEDLQTITNYLASDKELSPSQQARLTRAEGRTLPKGAVVVDKNGAARTVGGKKKAGDLRTDVFIPNADREGVGLAKTTPAGSDAAIKPLEEEAPPPKGSVSAFEANGVNEAAQQVGTEDNNQQNSVPATPVNTAPPLVRTDPKGWAKQQAEKISDDFTPQEKRAVTKAINALADIQVDGDAAMQQIVAQAKENVANMFVTQGIAAGTTLSNRDIEGFLNDEIQRISSTVTETAQGEQQASGDINTQAKARQVVKPAEESTAQSEQASQQQNTISDAAQNVANKNNIQATQQQSSNVNESTNVDTETKGHTPEEQATINGYQAAVNTGLKAIVQAHINKASSFVRQVINKVTNKQAADISALVGGDYTGFSNAINSNGISHILSEHGPNGTVDHSLADVNDIARIGYVLDNYDKVERATYPKSGEPKYSKEFRDSNNKPAPLLLFYKKVDGVYYVVEAAPDTQHKKLWVVSAYIKQNKGKGVTQASDAKTQSAPAPNSTTESTLASQPSPEDSITHDENRVNVTKGKTKVQGSNLPSQTQTRGALNNEKRRAQYISEKYGVGDGTYQSYTRKQISEMADACIEELGLEAEWERLVNKKKWDRVDFSEAGKIILEMTMNLNDDMVDGRPRGEVEEMYQKRREPIDALLQAYRDQKTTVAQELQEKYNFSTADELRMRAAQRFLNYTEDGMVHGANNRQINARMFRIVEDLVAKAEAADESQNVKSIVDNIKLVNRIRGREALLGKTGQAMENWMLDRMVKNGVDLEALTAMMYGSINKIMDDLTPMSYAEMIESVRMTNMLSNVATGLNNLLNNAVALFTGSLAQNASIPFAKVFEGITGKKVAVGDTSLLRTKPIRRAEEVALEYAILSSYYGMNGDEGRIDIKHGDSGFNVHGGWLERALARYNFFVQSFVLNPDAPAKARAELGIQQGIDKAFEGEDLSNPEVLRNKKELEGYAHKEAQRRVLQGENKYTKAVMYLRDHFLGKYKTPGENKMIGNRRLGSFDLGKFMLAFAKVPTNVGIQKVAATPYGALYHAAKYAYTLAKAKADPDSVTVNEMAKASRDIGRAATTAGMIGLGALAAMTGALKNFDDNDDEEEKKLAAERGYKGLTLNLSEIFRPGDQWREDDVVLSANFLEILATPLAIGAMIYDARKEGLTRMEAIKHGTAEAFVGMMDAVMEIPGLQQIGDLYQSFAYRNANENDLKGAVKAITEFAVNSGTSYVMPNIVSQASAGLDNQVRDVYKTDTFGQRLWNIVKNKTPFLRQSVPVKTDSLGDVRTYGDSKLMGFINTVLLPGDIRKYHVNELAQELFRLNAAGYKSTWFDTKGPKTIDVDGETYMLDADQQRAYHEVKAKYLVEAYDAFRTSDVYKTLSDEERFSVYKQLRLDAERQTKQEILDFNETGAEVTMAKWETELKTLNDKVNYLVAKETGSELWNDEEYKITDYAAMDAYMKKYGKLSEKQRELLDGSLSQFDDIYDASKAGINSKMWQKAYDIYRDYNSEEGKARVEGGYKGWEATQMWTDIQKATGASEDQMAWFEENMKLYNHIPADYEKYHVLVDSGWSRDQAQSLAKSISELEPANGNTTVSYKQRLTAIAKLAGVDDSLRWDAFFEYCPKSYTSVIRKMSSLRAAGKTYKEALTAAGKWMD